MTIYDNDSFERLYMNHIYHLTPRAILGFYDLQLVLNRLFKMGYSFESKSAGNVVFLEFETVSRREATLRLVYDIREKVSLTLFFRQEHPTNDIDTLEKILTYIKTEL